MTIGLARRSLAVSLLALALLRAQDASSGREPWITETRVRETVTWLASDERAGRDCPSPGLEAAADWIAARFQKAGLKPGGAEGSFRRVYELPGQRLESTALVVRANLEAGEGEAKAKHAFELKGETDVRLLRGGSSAVGRADNATPVRPEDPRFTNALQMGGARRPTLVVVPEAHPIWAATSGTRELLSRRLANSQPVFLVRRESLPEPVRPLVDAESPTNWSLEWEGAEAKETSIPLSNVVGILEGDATDEFVVVSAHYDHIGTAPWNEGDMVNNGADDDATGTTAVILLAEAMAKEPKPKRSIAFVCFSAEEKGLRGSAAFVENPPFPLEQVVANLNIEMLGRPEAGKEKKAWITGAEYSDFAAIATAALTEAGVGVTEFAMAKQLFAQSDNLSFARKGIVAHSISAGSLHQDYHQPGDEIEKLDVPHMTVVIRGLKQAVRAFADREGKPAWTEEGQRIVERLRSRGR